MGQARPQRVALISIHPRHAEAILDGRKLVELRRAPFAPDTTHALLYATAPVQAVVGWFEVAGIETDSMTSLWDRFGRLSAVSRREHRAYFSGAKQASAIRIATAQRYPEPLPLTRFPNVRRPPQSFQYLEPNSVLWAFAPAGTTPLEHSWVMQLDRAPDSQRQRRHSQAAVTA